MSTPKNLLSFSPRNIETGVKYKNSYAFGLVFMGVAKHAYDGQKESGVGKNGRTVSGSKRMVIIEAPEGNEEYIGCIVYPKNKKNQDYWNAFYKAA